MQHMCVRAVCARVALMCSRSSTSLPVVLGRGGAHNGCRVWTVGRRRSHRAHRRPSLTCLHCLLAWYMHTLLRPPPVPPQPYSTSSPCPAALPFPPQVITSFQPEPFWAVRPQASKGGQRLELEWARGRVFDQVRGMVGVVFEQVWGRELFWTQGSDAVCWTR